MQRLSQLPTLFGNHMSTPASKNTKEVDAALQATGAGPFFSPPNSRFQPIEQGFAKLKHLLRKAAERDPEAHRRSV
jgi:hypothetical protein